MKGQRYIQKLKNFLPISFPQNWNLKFGVNLDEKINCAECGEVIRLVDSHKSQFLFDNEFMLSFQVCSCCHEKEIMEVKKSEQKQ